MTSDQKPPATALSLSHDPLVRVQNVGLSLAGNQILSNVSFEVAQGQFACICGPNGAGKTMLLKVILGLMPPSEGSVRLFDSRPSDRAGRSRIGYVPQKKAFDRRFPASVEDVIVANLRGSWPLIVKRRETELAKEALELVGGGSLLKRNIADLSGGEMQRAFIARAMVVSPELLLLDEPMAGVDAKGNGEFMNLLARLAADAKLTAILITHSQEVVRRCASQLIFMVKGRVMASGNPEKLLLDHQIADLAFTGHDHEHSV